MFDRTVSVYRANATAGVGAQGYSATRTAGETLVLSGLPAEVQFKRRAGAPNPGVPSDTPSIPGWSIFIQNAYAPLGSIQERDVIVDDLGKRYLVSGAYWNVLGYNVSASMLEA